MKMLWFNYSNTSYNFTLKINTLICRKIFFFLFKGIKNSIAANQSVRAKLTLEQFENSKRIEAIAVFEEEKINESIELSRKANVLKYFAIIHQNTKATPDSLSV